MPDETGQIICSLLVVYRTVDNDTVVQCIETCLLDNAGLVFERAIIKSHGIRFFQTAFMKPLSARQKNFLYSNLVFGKLRVLAKPCYDLILGSILIVERVIDFFIPKDDSNISDITLIIKTFERHYAVTRLVKSIKRRYPMAKILVVNDSRKPKKLDGVENLIMPYDTGISAGRNAALDHIDTRYFLLLDDDFVFSRRQKLGFLISQMEEHGSIDILGGRCIDLPFCIIHDFQYVPVPSSVEPKTPIHSMLGKNRVVDKVQNYFIARTESVRRVRWNDDFKVLEHTEFFTRARGQITTAFRDDMLVLHAKTPFDIAYHRHRFRTRATS